MRARTFFFAPGAVGRLFPEELAHYGVHTLKDLLNFFPGLAVENSIFGSSPLNRRLLPTYCEDHQISGAKRNMALKLPLAHLGKTGIRGWAFINNRQTKKVARNAEMKVSSPKTRKAAREGRSWEGSAS